MLIVFSLAAFESASGVVPGVEPSVARIVNARGAFRRPLVYSSGGREAYGEVVDTFVDPEEFELVEYDLDAELEEFSLDEFEVSPAFETRDLFAQVPSTVRFVEPAALELEEFAERVAALERSEPEPELEADPEPQTEEGAAVIEASADSVEEPATIIVGMPPAYPKVALRMGWEGTVTCSIEIDANGQVAKVEVATSSGYDALDQAAVEAIRGWVFEAGSSGGRATRTTIEHKVHFEITG